MRTQNEQLMAEQVARRAVQEAAVMFEDVAGGTVEPITLRNPM